MLWKELATSVFETYFWIGLEHNKRIFGNIENENNKGLSQIPNEFRCFCMDLIKEQLLKH